MKDKELLLKLGQKVKAERITKDLSQEKLAGRAGLNTRSISLLESGLRDIKFSTLSCIAQALEVEIGVLTNFEEK
jgi:transcriptional regulator with XRE-family HTH domain